MGEFKTKLLTTSRGGKLRIENVGAEQIPAAFVIYTDGKTYGDIIPLDELAANRKIDLSAQTINKLVETKRPHATFLKAARKQLLLSLTKAGLFQDEARAMIDAWENGYFKTPGLRILYVLSRREVEEILPVRVSPAPDELNRVFVGRIEVLLDTVGERFLDQILKETDQYDVSQLGRMAQPILLRVQELARSKGVLTTQLSDVIDSLISQIP